MEKEKRTKLMFSALGYLYWIFWICGGMGAECVFFSG
jgi:hypothetical protein